ncbi:hypothetical protein PoB_001244600 [Plakobranchus ocellatus]|uniref:Uncharacterized protein n=1 Tax=Plakobranchus ocellatus TaxID=259542 RepID=A0AAV3YF61_9GAST|nr:hypothetical protein PoB_001244600 [Plakobranchus ocellatus]
MGAQLVFEPATGKAMSDFRTGCLASVPSTSVAIGKIAKICSGLTCVRIPGETKKALKTLDQGHTFHKYLLLNDYASATFTHIRWNVGDFRSMANKYYITVAIL